MDGTYIPPSAKPRPERHSLVGILVIIVLALALVFVTLLLPVAQELVSAATMPAELRGAQFVSAREDGEIVYGVSGVRFVAETRRQAPEVASVLSTERNAERMKWNWTLSPNKTSVAFSELVVPHYERRTDSWQVSLTDARTGSQRALGAGFGAIFPDEQHVVRLAPTGLVETDLTTNEERVLLPLTFERTPETVSISPNGALIAWPEPEGHAVVVYTVADGSATRVTRYEGMIDSFALGDGALYLLRQTKAGTEISRYPFTEEAQEVRIHTLPASLRVSAIALN